jgi:hypothetical protein
MRNVVPIPAISVSMRIDVPTRAQMDRIRRVMGWSCVEMFRNLARKLLGEPNKRLLTKTEWRFGTNGSLSLHLQKSTFYNFETVHRDDVVDLKRESLYVERA